MSYNVISDVKNFVTGKGDNSIKHADWPKYRKPRVGTLTLPGGPMSKARAPKQSASVRALVQKRLARQTGNARRPNGLDGVSGRGSQPKFQSVRQYEKSAKPFKARKTF